MPPGAEGGGKLELGSAPQSRSPWSARDTFDLHPSREVLSQEP